MQVIAFDIGNVLVEFDLNNFTKGLEIFGIDSKDAMEFLEINQVPNDLGFTNIGKSFIEHSRFGQVYKGEIKKIIKMWNEILVINKSMMKLINGSKIQIALWSNMGIDHMKYLRDNHSPLFENKLLHLSCDVGARKPQKLFYQSFLLEHNMNGKDIILIDDIQENLNGAAKFGIKGHHFDLRKSIKENRLDEEISRMRHVICI